MKGYLRIHGKTLALGVQAVGARVRHAFEAGAGGAGGLVVIGLHGLDPEKVRQSFDGA